MFLVLETLENTRQTRKQGNIISATKVFLNLLGHIFCFLGSKFCFRNNVSRSGQTEKHSFDRKHNASATMFPSLPKA